MSFEIENTVGADWYYISLVEEELSALEDLDIRKVVITSYDLEARGMIGTAITASGAVMDWELAYDGRADMEPDGRGATEIWTTYFEMKLAG